jgi:hypothetical protein
MTILDRDRQGAAEVSNEMDAASILLLLRQ